MFQLTSNYYRPSGYDIDDLTEGIATINLHASGQMSFKCAPAGTTAAAFNLLDSALIITSGNDLTLGGDITPDTNNAHTLGSLSRKYLNGYFFQIALSSGTARQLNIFGTQPATASRNITFPDPGANCDVVLTASNQTIGGTKTFSSSIAASADNTIDIGALATRIKDVYCVTTKFGGTTRNMILTASQPATASRTVTIPDPGADCDVLLSRGSGITVYQPITSTSSVSCSTLTAGGGASPYLSMDSNAFQKGMVSRDFTSAEIKTLYSTGWVLCNAPGAGRAFMVTSFNWNYHYNSVAYLNGGTIFPYVGASTLSVSPYMVFTTGIPAGWIRHTASNVGSAGVDAHDGDLVTTVANQALRLGAISGDFNTGNGTLSVWVEWISIPVS